MFDWLVNLSYNPYLLYFILLVPAIIFSIVAQIKVKSSYNKYSKVENSLGLTGAEVARRILDSKGLQHIQVVPIRGNLTDNYNPKTDTVSLSEGVYSSRTIAAAGIAAHEVGHAIQHNENYAPVRLRMAMVTATNIGSRLSGILIFAGLILMAISSLSNWGYFIAIFGVLLFSLSAIFQLVTLPVEFNASKRAMQQAEVTLCASSEDRKGIKKVLSAAAMTYVAALFVALMQVLYYVLLIVGRRRD